VRKGRNAAAQFLLFASEMQVRHSSNAIVINEGEHAIRIFVVECERNAKQRESNLRSCFMHSSAVIERVLKQSAEIAVLKQQC